MDTAQFNRKITYIVAAGIPKPYSISGPRDEMATNFNVFLIIISNSAIFNTTGSRKSKTVACKQKWMRKHASCIHDTNENVMTVPTTIMFGVKRLNWTRANTVQRNSSELTSWSQSTI